MSDVTRILSQIDQGDPQAAEKLLPLVYDELRKLAAAKLAQERPGQTLQPTALVHEAFLRLVSGGEVRDSGLEANRHTSESLPSVPNPEPRAPTFNSRGHFFGAAAEAMRRILVEDARRKHALQRGGGRERVDLSLVEPAAPQLSSDVLALNDALEKLEMKDRLKAELVKLRFFAGLTMEQAAGALDISAATAHRHWNYARAWLHQEILGNDAHSKNS
jgi:DNA-directed RNA polymerase specialized sigma24 family protein